MDPFTGGYKCPWNSATKLFEPSEFKEYLVQVKFMMIVHIQNFTTFFIMSFYQRIPPTTSQQRNWEKKILSRRLLLLGVIPAPELLDYAYKVVWCTENGVKQVFHILEQIFIFLFFRILSLSVPLWAHLKLKISFLIVQSAGEAPGSANSTPRRGRGRRGASTTPGRPVSVASSDEPGSNLVIWGTNVVVNRTKRHFRDFMLNFRKSEIDEDEVNPHQSHDANAPLYMQKIDDVCF